MAHRKLDKFNVTGTSHRRAGRLRIQDSLFTAYPATGIIAGVDRLSASLTLNGTTVDPAARYKGGDASASGWDAWTYGDDMSLSGSGTAPEYNQGSPVVGNSSDDSVRFNGSNYGFIGSTAATAQPGTNDFVYEMILERPNLATLQYPFNHLGASGGGIFTRYNSANGQITLQFSDGTGNISLTTQTNVEYGWFHIMWFCDRSLSGSNGLRCYVNGQSVNGTNPSARQGSIAPTTALSFGRNTSYSAPYTGRIAYFATWNSSGWLDHSSMTETDALALDRFQTLVGSKATKAAGTAGFTSLSRAGDSASLARESGGVYRIYTVGQNWPRLTEWPGESGSKIRGLLREPSSTNLFSRSLEFDHADWTKVGTTPQADQITSPSGDDDADGIRLDNSSTSHYVEQSFTAVSGRNYVLSVFAKKGTQDWIQLDITGGVGANMYFDLDNGVLGTSGGAQYVDSGIDSLGDGWYRCWVVGSVNSATTTDFRIWAAEADGDRLSLGDNSSIGTYLWGAQLESAAGGGYKPSAPTSFIWTGAASTSRGTDDFSYSMSGGNSNGDSGSVEFKARGDEAPITQFSRTILSMDAGSGLADHVSVFTKSATSVGHLTVATGSVTQADADASSELMTGDNVQYKVVWGDNNFKLLIDGAEEVTDTSGTAPTLTRMRIGPRADGDDQSVPLIFSDIKIKAN
jgi:hypothetical protein